MAKKDIFLPPTMFENILSRATELYWSIPHDFLKACLSRREQLFWYNIDLTHGALREKDLLVIANSNLPVKRLSFRTHRMTEAMMEVVEQISPSLEVLEISFCAFDWDTFK